MRGFDELTQGQANHAALTPITHLARAAATFPQHPAVRHRAITLDYQTLWQRCRRLASALGGRGIGRSDVVSVMLPNIPGMIECHFGVPMIGAVLHSINTRLDPAAIAFQLDHAEAKVVICDREFSVVMGEALQIAQVTPLVIDLDDPEYGDHAPCPKGPLIGQIEYEDFLQTGDPDHVWQMPDDEWDAIALNYTSGTTGNPKGVVYHHRGAALMAYNNTLSANMGRHPVYLWTLPMFHCNGWCYPWVVPIQAGTQVCLRWVRAKPIFDAIADETVTHLCGAPIVASLIVNAQDQDRRDFDHQVGYHVAGAPPPESVLAAMADAGFDVTHVYGLTESYGPSVVNEWHKDWNDLPIDRRTALKARQGVRGLALDDLTVLDPETMSPVPADGETMGEVMMRGNIVMKGYLKNPKATDEAFDRGWFHTGDLAVLHPDGYIQLKDRAKDIIISGGENISSIEVENAFYSHPAVAACAVVARPDEKWGEVPVAFVELKPRATADEAELLAHISGLLARFKQPKTVILGEIPKTSTGKMQKFSLRDRV